MMYHILAIGDVAGESGVRFLCQHLSGLKKLKDISFCVVNGENAAVSGILPEQAERIFMAGADVITLGNHTYGKTQSFPMMDDNPYLLRPANYSSRKPGKGAGVYDCRGLSVQVINLIGRVDMKDLVDDPFAKADQLLKEHAADLVLVDFHAEATSEKIAMRYYLDGRVTALWGTHTHVPTADEFVTEKGTGYITDLGMTGPIHSVIGIQTEQSLQFFLGGIPGRYASAEGPCRIQGAIFHVDGDTKRCVGVERVEIQ